jgi:hypothetical protein
VWPKVARRLRQVQDTADWLHNLAQFAAGNFDGFDEAWFWREYETLVGRFPELHERLAMYRSFFE